MSEQPVTSFRSGACAEVRRDLKPRARVNAKGELVLVSVTVVSVSMSGHHEYTSAPVIGDERIRIGAGDI